MNSVQCMQQMNWTQLIVSIVNFQTNASLTFVTLRWRWLVNGNRARARKKRNFVFLWGFCNPICRFFYYFYYFLFWIFCRLDFYCSLVSSLRLTNSGWQTSLGFLITRYFDTTVTRCVYVYMCIYMCTKVKSECYFRGWLTSWSAGGSLFLRFIAYSSGCRAQWSLLGAAILQFLLKCTRRPHPRP